METKPTKEQVIETLILLNEMFVFMAQRYGDQEPNDSLISTLNYLKTEFDIKPDDLTLPY